MCGLANSSICDEFGCTWLFVDSKQAFSISSYKISTDERVAQSLCNSKACYNHFPHMHCLLFHYNCKVCLYVCLQIYMFTVRVFMYHACYDISVDLTVKMNE